jgi:hypothetical protein
LVVGVADVALAGSTVGRLKDETTTATPSEPGERGGALPAWGIKVPRSCQLRHLSARSKRRCLMKRPNRMTLELRPLHGGSYTQLSLSGPVPSAPRELRRLLTSFALWNGYPVDVVLSVDAETASWCEVWADALSTVPARHLEVCFEVKPARPVSEGR